MTYLCVENQVMEGQNILDRVKVARGSNMALGMAMSVGPSNTPLTISP